MEKTAVWEDFHPVWTRGGGDALCKQCHFLQQDIRQQRPSAQQNKPPVGTLSLGTHRPNAGAPVHSPDTLTSILG